MTSIIFGILHFFIAVFLPYIVPITAFGYGSYIFFMEGQYVASVLFFIAAIVFFVMFLLRRTPLTDKKIAWLKAQGQKVMTEFKSLDRRWNTRINGEPPMVIYTEANGRMFQSEDIWPNNGGPFYINDASTRALETLQSRDSNTKYVIPVYVNPTKSKEYYMDLGALEVK